MKKRKNLGKNKVENTNMIKIVGIKCKYSKTKGELAENIKRM